MYSQKVHYQCNNIIMQLTCGWMLPTLLTSES